MGSGWILYGPTSEFNASAPQPNFNTRFKYISMVGHAALRGCQHRAEISD